MARAKLGAIITDISGSIGGTTFRKLKGNLVLSNKNTGGSYSRRIIDSNLSKFRALVSNWSSLSETVRKNWATAATLYKFSGAFGSQKNLTGRELYLKLQGNLIVTGGNTIDPATIDNIISTQPITDTFLDSLFFELSALEPNSVLLLQADRPSIFSRSFKYTRSKILYFGTFSEFKIYSFLEVIKERYPQFSVGDYMNLYFTFMNSSGFRVRFANYAIQLAIPSDAIWSSRLVYNGIFSITVSGSGVLYWGDGTSDAYNGNDIVLNHNYVNFDGMIYFNGSLFKIVNNTVDSNLYHLLANLPLDFNYYHNTGQNTTEGNLADLPESLTTYYNIGQNIITGDIAELPNVMSFFYSKGQNTTTGNIADLPSVMNYYLNVGQNTAINYTSGRVWTENMDVLFSVPTVSYSSQVIDDLLIDLSLVVSWSGSKIIYLKGSRTAASDAAVATLVSKGVTITLV